MNNCRDKSLKAPIYDKSKKNYYICLRYNGKTTFNDINETSSFDQPSGTLSSINQQLWKNYLISAGAHFRSNFRPVKIGKQLLPI
jgi:hypothetical protein